MFERYSCLVMIPSSPKAKMLEIAIILRKDKCIGFNKIIDSYTNDMTKAIIVNLSTAPATDLSI